MTSISNDYFILSSNYDVSLTQVNVPGVGTYSTVVCLSNNQVTFKPTAMCCSANILLVGGGGGGYQGEIQPTSSTFNYPAGFGGGGGGGAAHFYGTAEITSSSGIFPYNQIYDISVASGGIGGTVYPPTTINNGKSSSFGRNYFSLANTPSVNGGNGGATTGSFNPFLITTTPGLGGTIVNPGIFTQIPGCGNSGGAGGNGSFVYNTAGPPLVNLPHNGVNAGNGNTGNPGQYNIPTYGTIYVAGGGAGGDVSGVLMPGPPFPPSFWRALPGKGGNAGNGLGGIGYGPGGDSGNGTTDSIGRFGLQNFYNAGGGGGGGGTPAYVSDFVTTTALGGDGARGMCLIQIFDPLPPPPLSLLPPPPPPPVPPFSSLNTDLFSFGINQYAYTQQTTMPNGDIYAFGICLSNNTITFKPDALGCPATILLVGGGGGGGGGYNSRYPGAGGGGGGGGQLYGISTVTSPGGNLPINTVIDISLGIGGIPGRGPYQGTSGGLSAFGANYYGFGLSPRVSGGGTGGATLDNSNNGGVSGSVISYGIFSNAGIGTGIGGQGGDGYKCWTSTSSATNGSNANLGIYTFSSYGILTAGGGGGGGGGIGGPFCEADVSCGFGGNSGLGSGGNAGSSGGNGTSDSIGDNALFNYFSAGGGGGGGGIPNYNELQYDVSGGYGAGGLFAIEIYKQYVPPPPPVPSNCPCPVIYKPIPQGDVNPQMFPGNRYAQYVRSSLGRPGYQRPRYGNRTLSPFGYWQGAPSGYGKPPQNSFV